MLLLKWKNNQPSEYEACCKSSTSNNLIKSFRLLILLLQFSSVDPSTTISSATVPSTTFHPPANSIINDMLNIENTSRSLHSSISTTKNCNVKLKLRWDESHEYYYQKLGKIKSWPLLLNPHLFSFFCLFTRESGIHVPPSLLPPLMFENTHQDMLIANPTPAY